MSRLNGRGRSFFSGKPLSSKACCSKDLVKMGLGAIFEGNTKYLSAHFQRIQRWAYTLGDPSKIGWLMSEEWGKNWEKLKDN